MKKKHSWARPHLELVAQDILARVQDSSIRAAKNVLELDSKRYVSSEFFLREKELLFGRVPLLLAASCEVDSPGDFKAISVAGIPVLLVRSSDATVHAYLNACTHRGAQLVEGVGHKNRLTCPYHGWTFSLEGELLAAPLREYFDKSDSSCYRLKEFPVTERAGLIWVTFDAEASLSSDVFLNGIDSFLGIFEFAEWQVISRKKIPGPNWKLAFDAHLEFYHLPVLHKETFGPDSSNRALYYFWGPHQRLIQPRDSKESIPESSNLFELGSDPGKWTLSSMMLGEWIIFPNVSINIFYNGGLGVLISQVIPGEDAHTSTTAQTYLMANEPDEDARRTAIGLCEFLHQVVAGEDIPMSYRQQLVMSSGQLPSVHIGRNEFGVQQFHRWVDCILETDSENLDSLFRQDQTWFGREL